MIEQLIECVEEFFLRAFLVSQGLDVIDQQDVSRPVILVKLRHAVGADALNHLVHEPLTGGVHDPHGGEVLIERPADGMHQMGFAHARSAVDEQRVVGTRWRCGHGLGGGVRELVAGANHERIEGELRIQR